MIALNYFSKSPNPNHHKTYALEHIYKHIVSILKLLRIINIAIKIDINALSLIAKNELKHSY